MYKNNLPYVKTYYHHIKKCMNNRPLPQSRNLSIDYFVNPKYLYLHSARIFREMIPSRLSKAW